MNKRTTPLRQKKKKKKKSMNRARKAMPYLKYHTVANANITWMLLLNNANVVCFFKNFTELEFTIKSNRIKLKCIYL